MVTNKRRMGRNQSLQIINTPVDMVVKEKSGLAEIVDAIKFIREQNLIEFEDEEKKREAQRLFANDYIFGLIENLDVGVKMGSIDHIETANNVIKTYIELNGLAKPINKKKEEKANFNINLEFGKPRE